MVRVETIARVRFEHLRNGKGIKRIARELDLARGTVRRILRSDTPLVVYRRGRQPAPRLGEWAGKLEEILQAEAALPRSERRSTLRLFEQLRGHGYDGAHDSVHRFVKAWRVERATLAKAAFVPLRFDPGEAYQFDWSHEKVELRGLPVAVKAAHMRLAYSRMPFVRVYFRETQELVFEAHDKAFAFFGGVCRRGIYDNMKTAVETIFVGKARKYNERFLGLCAHHVIDPVACTPAAGWEKGQVENQVGTLRDVVFRPRLRGQSLDEMNGWLQDQCVAYAKKTRHPEFTDRTVWEVFLEERRLLGEFKGPFDGFVEKPMRAASTCLVRHDRNRYSVDARAAGRAVVLRAHADRIVVLLDNEVVAEHRRSFKREQFIYDPWHYLPVLLRKPGVLRNGAPFKDWDLPPGLAAVRTKLGRHDDGDRQFVKILAAIPEHGLNLVEAACAEALTAGIASSDVVIAILARYRQPAAPPPMPTPVTLRLANEPVADCARYDQLRSPV
jgi:transposase